MPPLPALQLMPVHPPAAFLRQPVAAARPEPGWTWTSVGVGGADAPVPAHSPGMTPLLAWAESVLS